MTYKKVLYKQMILVLVFCAFSCAKSLPDEIEIAMNDLPEKVDFNFHVKPILSDRCYSCHGPDEKTRQAGLRLDIEKEAFKKLASGARAFVSGKPARSESVGRILSDDPEVSMPPPETAEKSVLS